MIFLCQSVCHYPATGKTIFLIEDLVELPTEPQTLSSVLSRASFYSAYEQFLKANGFH